MPLMVCPRLIGVMTQTPACLTVKVNPAMVSVPMREVVLALAATEYIMVLLPQPLLPAVIVIQLALLVAVKQQPGAMTSTLPVPPLAPNDWLFGERPEAQLKALTAASTLIRGLMRPLRASSTGRPVESKAE